MSDAWAEADAALEPIASTLFTDKSGRNDTVWKTAQLYCSEWLSDGKGKTDIAFLLISLRGVFKASLLLGGDTHCIRCFYRATRASFKCQTAHPTPLSAS